MKMKKIAALTLSVMMAFSLTACGSSDEDAAGSNVSSSDKSTGSQENPKEASTENAAENSKNDNFKETGNDGTDASTDSDLAYIKEKGVLVVGITDFEPMDYKDENGEWIGFDADMAKAFAESLDVSIEFVEIDWDNKIMELEGKTIDCVWNGMTLTEEVTSAMECTDAYCNNAQVVIVPADQAEQYNSIDSLSGLNFAAETGSAGEKQAREHGFACTPVKTQADALMEVAAGTSDAAIIDSLMAAAMVGEGTGYADLTYTVSLNDEEYGVGFRKGSDLAAALNDFFSESYADGSMLECAETYGVQAAVTKQ